jgi:hypothetical protein
VYFFANNPGPNDPHELVIIRTDLAPDQLPVVDGRVPEDQVDLIGEIEPFNPGTQAADTFSLEPGNYVLICNLAEVEEGEMESHYEPGMRARLVVEQATCRMGDRSSRKRKEPSVSPLLDTGTSGNLSSRSTP